jgi:hypothetical protein
MCTEPDVPLRKMTWPVRGAVELMAIILAGLEGQR